MLWCTIGFVNESDVMQSVGTSTIHHTHPSRDSALLDAQDVEALTFILWESPCTSHQLEDVLTVPVKVHGKFRKAAFLNSNELLNAGSFLLVHDLSHSHHDECVVSMPPTIESVSACDVE